MKDKCNEVYNLYSGATLRLLAIIRQAFEVKPCTFLWWSFGRSGKHPFWGRNVKVQLTGFVAVSLLPQYILRKLPPGISSSVCSKEDNYRLLGHQARSILLAIVIWNYLRNYFVEIDLNCNYSNRYTCYKRKQNGNLILSSSHLHLYQENSFFARYPERERRRVNFT